MSNFPYSPNRNITSHSMENLAFHSLLRWKMIIPSTLTTSPMHLSLKGWENVLFELGSERVKISFLLFFLHDPDRHCVDTQGRGHWPLEPQTAMVRGLLDLCSSLRQALPAWSRMTDSSFRITAWRIGHEQLHKLGLDKNQNPSYYEFVQTRWTRTN